MSKKLVLLIIKSMAIKVKAIETDLSHFSDKNGNSLGYRYVLKPELYNKLTDSKVISEAALRSGVAKGVMAACWDAAGEVIKAWATEGHSVALPGLGSMRFGLRAKAVEDVNKVKTSLIKTRRIIFVPAVDLKDELANTAIQITCYDRNGNEVKRVTSSDPGTVEDNENEENENGGSENSGSGSQNSGSEQQQNTLAKPTIYGANPFTESTEVTMSGPEDAEIRYTTDGSTPTAESTLYEGGFTLSDTTTVKAIAIKNGESSEVSTRLFSKGSGGDTGGNGDME
jgi:predicted histone-like DNA-binding protein